MADGALEQVRLNGAVPQHVAIIMDGNGRWARGRSLPRPLGHHAGMEAVREVVAGCLDAGVEVLSLFAFSTEQRARRFAIEQNILAAEGEFQGAPTRPVDIVRNASTYSASGVEAIMIDGHRTGHFLPMQNLGRYWEQLCGPLPE